MSTTSALSADSRTSSTNAKFVRSALTMVAALGIVLTSAHAAAAQAPAQKTSRWELRVSSGAFVPTGDQRNALKDAQVSAAQLSWLVRPSLAVTGTFGWARSRDIASVDAPKLDVFTSDVGVEVRPAQWLADRAVTFDPFMGGGAGARSYNYRNLNVDATNNLAGYVSVGGELGMGRVGVRVEARDYVSGFKPLTSAGRSDTRNDIVLTAALRFKRR